MKKIFICNLVLLFSVSLSFAAPIYGPKMPEKGKIHIGGQTYSVFHRDLENESGEMESLQHFLLLSYGLTDWLSVDLKGGAGDITYKPNVGQEIDYPAFMAGGYGFRVKLFENKNWKAVWGFQHISVHPYSIWIGNTKYKSVLDNWQGSALISYKTEKLTPYFGLKGSRSDYIQWINENRNRIKSDEEKVLGIIVGTNISLNEKTWINIEGQFLDTKAMSVSLNYEF